MQSVELYGVRVLLGPAGLNETRPACQRRGARYTFEPNQSCKITCKANREGAGSTEPRPEVDSLRPQLHWVGPFAAEQSPLTTPRAQSIRLHYYLVNDSLPQGMPRQEASGSGEVYCEWKCSVGLPKCPSNSSRLFLNFGPWTLLRTATSFAWLLEAWKLLLPDKQILPCQVKDANKQTGGRDE
jgi:hypothetical protein